MFTILLHSSKTMRPPASASNKFQQPSLQRNANELAGYLKTLSVSDLRQQMHLSEPKAEQTHELLQSWSQDPSQLRPAIDAFLGDIYSGLQVQSFDRADRQYANDHLLILSGLYGVLRALDSIYPYRLEMGYKLPRYEYADLPAYWDDKIARLIPEDTTVVNLSAVEYTKAVLPYISNTVITPKFLTVSPKTNEPAFVTVHAKIARGAFAHWMVKRRVTNQSDINEFDELGYSFSPQYSTTNEPVFICKTFKGLGLSVRLT